MIKFNVEVEDWETYCSEGSLEMYGTSIFVNDVNITNYFQINDTIAWEDLFKALGIKNVLVTYKNR